MPLVERHTVENIAAWAEKAAERFGLSLRNVLAVVHDNADHGVAAVRILDERKGRFPPMCRPYSLVGGQPC